MVAGFTGMRPGDRPVHLGSLGSMGHALEVVGFIRGRSAHWGAPWWSWGSSGYAVFTGVRLGSRRVYPGSLGSIGYTLGGVMCILGH